MSLRIAVIWQRFLPYHQARLRRLGSVLEERGDRLTAIEVASQDVSYGFPEAQKTEAWWTTCFPGEVYQRLSADVIHEKVLGTLRQCIPDIVFAPATAFPEGMAALKYRLESGCRALIMDDAWEMTDRRGPVTRTVKRLVHGCAEGAFIPAPSHLQYYESLNIPKERIVFGVDVVDNDYFAAGTEAIRKKGEEARNARGLPQAYFLFAGRFLKKKGIDTLLDAFRTYRDMHQDRAWDLVLVGDGPELDSMKKRALDMSGVHFAGQRLGEELLACYAFAKALVVPSEQDPWALVVNEGMASGLPVIVSRGCGSARTLVIEGENGWTFDPGNADGLAGLMHRMSSLSAEELKKMSDRSLLIISEWSPDRFVQGVLSAMSIPRREQQSMLAALAVRFWKGRVSVN